MKQLWLGLAIVLTLFLSACSDDNAPPDVNALVYENAKPLADFSLDDQHGELVTKQQFLGQWNLVFLGYTSCPDICPLTLAKLNAVYKNLRSDYPVQIWFVSVDPKRDTPAKRKDYIDYFNPDFLAVSGEHKQLFPMVRGLGLIYAISDSSESEYAVDHSASVAMVDGNGAVRAIFKPEFKQGSVPLINSKELTQEFKKIADYYKN
ncbi:MULTISPECIES: SCO family protein [unclassified Pseudoalteromonas]|uniref:SCO family protein n=1 Tax=unclassified Pseudoalteromonas TaxID=194690 RepID=UPI00097F44A6|nr:MULTISPECIES: SCO family protein [unclassified Pseudoalteromonas]MBH0071961.1 SCO family protein [Pseudoalteromonas sp. NZS127]PCC14621.1 SCO family protein [Pseudoalteromonas sp. JB197]SJN44660.1 Cytochrome oxidase biogenesis protein Sco1/SenC/PrrC, putative copper metallochaperone [Pseudoalteromonas sp. JB197]